MITLDVSRLDTKQTEIARTLLCDDRLIRLGTDPGGVPVVLKPLDDVDSQIVIDVDDRPPVDLLYPHKRGVCVYLKLQVHDPAWYEGKQQTDLLLLSMPMLLGGSKIYVMAPDEDGLHTFARTILSRPDYADRQKDLGCSFIGAMTCQARADALTLLVNQVKGMAYVVAKPGHATADQATVPYDEYIKVSRRSRVCASLNGQGPFCLKDGELFSNACAVLRQDHPALHINSLSPQHRRQWFVAATKDMPDAATELLANPKLCEELAVAGWSYLHSALFERRFANVYAPAVHTFLTTGKRDDCEGILLGS